MTGTAAQNGIISDANMLIDYAISAPNILKLFSEHVCQLYVAPSILKEVNQLSGADIAQLGIEIIDPTLSQIIEAAEMRKEKPVLSGKDIICFVLAKDNGWNCLTNDKPLRSHCAANSVSCLWGFEIMLPLVSCEKLTSEKAYKIAQDIRSKNKFIKPETVERFKEKLGL